MLNIIVAILKIIGILLLIVLALLLAAVLAVLFAAVHYRAAVDALEKLRISWTVKWLFPLFYMKGSYCQGETDAEPAVNFYLCGFRLRSFGKKEKVQKDEKEEMQTADKEPQIQALSDDIADFNEASEKTVSLEPSAHAKTDDFGSNTEEQSADPKKKKFSWSACKEKFSKVRAVFTDEKNKRALSCLLHELRSLLRHYGPRKVQGEMAYAAGDPAYTGLLTGALSLCPFAYGKKLSLIPDFESEQFYVRGCVSLGGRIRLVHLLKSLLVLLLNPDVRAVFKKIRK